MAGEGTAGQAPPTRAVEPDGGAWTWRLPAPEAPALAPPPPTAGGGPVCFVTPRAGPEAPGCEVYARVGGRTAVADILRVPEPLPPEVERLLPGLLHRAVAQRPRAEDPDAPTDPNDTPPVWSQVLAFLEHGEESGAPDAARVRSLLGEQPPDPVFATRGAHRTLGLGRFVVPEREGVARHDRLIALLPAASAPLLLDTCRILAELTLTAALFAAADKASAPSLARVARAYFSLARGEGRLPARTLRLGTAALMVDHARRLESHMGRRPQLLALELAQVRRLLSSAHPPEPEPEQARSVPP